MLQRRQRTDLSFLSGYFTEFFDSGTSALAIAIARALEPLVKSGSRPSVLLPAYGCPNLISATLWAGGRPEFIDLAPGSIIPDERELVARLNTRDVVVVAVDAFGVPSLSNAALVLPVADPTLPLVHDLAQSFAPYVDGWKNIAPQSIISFGRAKPMSLTMGGGLLSIEPPTVVASKRVYSIASPPRASLLLRAALYNASLLPQFFGLLSLIPFLRIGRTDFRPHESVGKYATGFECMVESATSFMKMNLSHLTDATRVVLESVVSARAILPAPVLESKAGNPLWRLPLIAASEQDAARIEDMSRALGVTRLYGRTLPEFLGESPEECAIRWPHAFQLSRRLLTLPTHGRLMQLQLKSLIKMIGVSSSC